MKVLFILKKKSSSAGTDYSTVLRSGLYNSALMTAKELSEHFLTKTKVEIVIDGNGVDKQVSLYKPDICIIEAIWVTPDKIKELTKLHPTVRWIVRVHSELPFLANEGNAIDWIKEYINIKNVEVSFNSDVTTGEFKNLLSLNKSQISYLPNLYDSSEIYINENQDVIGLGNLPKVINVGCFGAIRPMKNQLIQAFGAIAFGDVHNVKIKFHINHSRTEQGGGSVLKNIRALFENTRHQLVEHEWMERIDFLKLIKDMDIGLQVSLTESFNIVTADFVAMSVPIVVSDAIRWMPNSTMAKDDSAKSIQKVMEEIFEDYQGNIDGNKEALIEYNKEALDSWKDEIEPFK